MYVFFDLNFKPILQLFFIVALCFEIPFIIMQDLLQGDVIVSDA
jgi:hypothetical protein